METFGTLLKDARLRSTNPKTKRIPLSQEALTEKLNSATGLNYTRISLRNWENDKNKIHHTDRTVLVNLIKVLKECKGMSNDEAHQLLLVGDYRALDEKELQIVDLEWTLSSMNPQLPTPAVQAAALPGNPPLMVDAAGWIAQLAAQFMAQPPPPLVVLAGVAGSGKSVAAVAIAQHLVTQSNFQHVLRIVLDPAEPDPIAAVAEGLARQIFSQGLADSADKPTLIQNYLRQQSYFVVIDGLKTVSDELCEQLSTWAQPSSFLVTSRIRPNNTNFYTRDVPVWQTETARKFVRDLAASRGQSLSQLTDQQLDTLCQQLGHNPEALQLILSLAQRRSTAQLIATLQHSKKVDELQAEVTATAWQQLQADARLLLTVFCFINESGSSDEFLGTVSGLKDAVWHSLEALEQHVLIINHAAQDGRFYAHQLAVDYVAKQDHAQLAQVGAAVLGYWQQRFERLPLRDWYLLINEQPNIFFAVRRCLQLTDPTITQRLIILLPLLDKFAERWGYTRTLVPLLAQAVTRPIDEAVRCDWLVLLGSTQRRQSAWQSAQTTLQAALALAKQLGKVEREADAYWELASVYKGQQEWDSAETHVLQALTRYEQQQNTHGIGLANNLRGLLAYEQEAFEPAVSLLQQAASHLTEDKRALALSNLAAVLQAQEKYKAAGEAASEARSLYKQYGSAVDRVRITITEASMYAAQEKWDSADNLLESIDIKTVADVQLQGFYWWNWGILACDQEHWLDAKMRLQKCVEAWQITGDQKRLARAERRLAQIDADDKPGRAK